MNWRLVVFSSVVTAVLGGLTGITFSYLGQPDVGRFRYESGLYERLYRSYPMIGAGLGAAIGGGFAVISQSSRRRSASPNRPDDPLNPPARR
ncbi:hypothetical protein [Synechococcus sp. GFB01]|uniref:hypothetical protein n=1 Tax=Synechococcus sp. GFB01 TaxID=1662190 RepID=UPI0009081339|nr:hypothetical protein [Synechococcus sp. GFB01]